MKKTQKPKGRAKLWACLVDVFKYIFSVFKEYYMYFYIFFHPHIFLKKLKTVA